MGSNTRPSHDALLGLAAMDAAIIMTAAEAADAPGSLKLVQLCVVSHTDLALTTPVQDA